MFININWRFNFLDNNYNFMDLLKDIAITCLFVIGLLFFVRGLIDLNLLFFIVGTFMVSTWASGL